MSDEDDKNFLTPEEMKDIWDRSSKAYLLPIQGPDAKQSDRLQEILCAIARKHGLVAALAVAEHIEAEEALLIPKDKLHSC